MWRTIAKYEKILGIDIRTEFPEVGPHANIEYRMISALCTSALKQISASTIQAI